MEKEKRQNRIQEIAVHPDHKKLNSSVESKLLPKIKWEQEVNSKKSAKKSFLQKLIHLANAFQNAIQILLLDKLSEIFGI